MTITPHGSSSTVTLHHGDCLDILREFPDNSVDSVVTDPPYGLEFMGKDWDAPWLAGAGTGGHSAGFKVKTYKDGSTALVPNYTGSTNPTCRNCGGLRSGRDGKKGQPPCRCDAPRFDNTTLPRMRAFGEWCELWTAECLRVLKPGGHLLAFGGTRTWHRLACAVEDAGFEVRDSIAWLYGSGFPKSLDVSKAIDKAAQTRAELDAISARARGDWDAERRALDSLAQAERQVVGPDPNWRARVHSDSTYDGGQKRPESLTAPATDDARAWQGWGTALKPAFEPVVVARKPLSSTVAANVLAHGTGALNIDGCRIGDEPAFTDRPGRKRSGGIMGRDAGTHTTSGGAGRWPANVVLDETQAAELDEQSGTTQSRIGVPRGADSGDGWGMTATGAEYDDRGGASRFFYVARRDDPCSSSASGTGTTGDTSTPPSPDSPSTSAEPVPIGTLGSRFNYTAKADASERVRVSGVAHPTVKPLALMRWLVRLVTPPGGTVLEPFAGSGTTVEACILEGFRCIAIEREADYLPLIMQRINRRVDPVAAVRAADPDDGGLFDLLDGGAA